MEGGGSLVADGSLFGGGGRCSGVAGVGAGAATAAGRFPLPGPGSRCRRASSLFRSLRSDCP